MFCYMSALCSAHLLASKYCHSLTLEKVMEQIVLLNVALSDSSELMSLSFSMEYI